MNILDTHRLLNLKLRDNILDTHQCNILDTHRLLNLKLREYLG